jgi:hypothetical protein
MAVAIHRGFVLGEKGYKLPAKFAMFSQTGNHLVREALAAFLAHPNTVFSKNHTPDARLAAFQDTSVTSSLGHVTTTILVTRKVRRSARQGEPWCRSCCRRKTTSLPIRKRRTIRSGTGLPFRGGQKASVWDLWRALNVGNAWGISLARCAYRRHPCAGLSSKDAEFIELFGDYHIRIGYWPKLGELAGEQERLANAGVC